MKVLHLITGLGTGGAEAMLVKLISCETDPDSQIVVSLSKGGNNKIALQKLGVRVFELDLKRWWALPVQLFKVRQLLVKESVNVVHAWMYHAALFSCLLAFFSWKKQHRVWLWNIRHSLQQLGNEKAAIRLIIRLLGKLSWFPALIIFNSQKSIAEHQVYWKMGQRVCFLPNGFDTEMWQPQTKGEAQLTSLRLTLGDHLLRNMKGHAVSDTRWLGHVGRVHPMKNHIGLIAAFEELADEFPNVNLILVGRGTENLPIPTQLQSRIILSGERQDVEKIMPCLDYFILCSNWGEGFPNVLGEAMSCGIACSTTDVGDGAFLLNNPDLTVKANAHSDLVALLRRLFAMEPDSLQRLGDVNRSRIIRQFTLPVIHQKYCDLYHEALKARAGEE